MLVYCPYHIARSIRLGPEVDHRRGCCQISSLNVDVFITTAPRLPRCDSCSNYIP